MTGLRRALLAIGLLGLMLMAAEIAIVATSDTEDAPVVDAILIGAVMAAWIGTGLFAWARRPANRIGFYMVAVGFAFFLSALVASDAPLVFSIGLAFNALCLAVAVHMLLAYPTGRVEQPYQQRLVYGIYALATLVPVGIMFFRADCRCGIDDPPKNVFLIHDVPALADTIEIAGSLIGIALVVAVAKVLIDRWRRASPGGRRELAPVLWTGAALVTTIAAALALNRPGVESTAAKMVSLIMLTAFAAVPFAFLVGLARSRWWRAGAILDVVGALGAAPSEERLRHALSDALGDPTLEVVYWLPEREHFVDSDGRRAELNRHGDDRACIPVEHEGRLVGGLIYDAALNDDPALVVAVASAAALSLENARLDAELRARVEELERSRRGLVEAGLAERRRLERDLHDGAQQRLVSLSLQLGLINTRLDADPAAARELLDGAREEARSALEDLRELARGIHPAVLTDRGLGPALESLADRAPLPVEVERLPEERLPASVELAAYFVVAESLTNVSKYAHASHAEVRVGRENGFALVEVRDDGIGGADPAAGTGLRGLADRLAALDGRLEVESEPGRGTVVRARVPCPN